MYLLSSITPCTHIIGDGYTHPYSVKYPFEANFYSCPNKHLGWNFRVSNVGHSQQPFFRTFWFGFSEKACVDFVASLNKASKFADILPELLKYDWFVNSCAPPTNWKFAGDWSDVAPSGDYTRARLLQRKITREMCHTTGDSCFVSIPHTTSVDW